MMRPLLCLAATLVASQALAAPKNKSQGVEVSVRSSPGPVCRVLRSTFLSRETEGVVGVPSVDESFAPALEARGSACEVQAVFRDELRDVSVLLGDGGTSLIETDDSVRSRKPFRAVDRSAALRGQLGDTHWATTLTPAELTTLGVPHDTLNYLDLSSIVPTVVRVRRCEGSTCEAYHQINTAASSTPSCTLGLQVRLVDEQLQVTPPRTERCLVDTDGAALAVFPASALTRTQTLSIAVPGYDLPALLVQLPRTIAQLLVVDVTVLQEPN